MSSLLVLGAPAVAYDLIDPNGLIKFATWNAATSSWSIPESPRGRISLGATRRIRRFDGDVWGNVHHTLPDRDETMLVHDGSSGLPVAGLHFFQGRLAGLRLPMEGAA